MLQDCYKVYQSLEKLPQLVNALQKHESRYSTLLNEVFITTIVVLQGNTLFQHRLYAV